MLVPKLTATGNANCTTIQVWDTTGGYDAVTNPGGWGAPNYATTDVVVATINFYVQGYVNPISIDVTARFSDLFTANGITFTPADVFGGSATTFPDGCYRINYALTFAGRILLTYDAYWAFLCSSICCVRKASSMLQYPIEDFKMVEKAFYMYSLLQKAQWAGCCGLCDDVNSAIAELKSLCEGCGIQSTVTTNSSGCGCGS